MKTLILSVIFYNAIQFVNGQPQNGLNGQNSQVSTDNKPISQSWVWGRDIQDTLDNIEKQTKERQRIQNIMDEFRRKHQEQTRRSNWSAVNNRIFFKLIWVIFVIIPLTCFCFCRRHRKPQEREEREPQPIFPVQQNVMENPTNPSNVFFIITQDAVPSQNSNNTEQPPSYEEVVEPVNNPEELPPSYEETIEQQQK